MQINHRKKFAVVAGTVAAVLLGGGIAAAYWSSTGTGTGSATTANPTGLTLSTVNAATGLYPGGPAQDVDIRITNPNPGTVRVSGLSFSVTGSTPAGCNAGNFTLTQPTLTALGGFVDVPGSSFVDVDATDSNADIAMLNLASNQDACKNVTVNFSLTSS